MSEGPDWLRTNELRYFRSPCGSYMHLYQKFVDLASKQKEWRLVPTDGETSSSAPIVCKD